MLAALFGDLAVVPWHVRFAVPTATVLATWRTAAGPEPLEQLQGMVLAPSDAKHQAHDYRAADAGDLALGSVTRVPDIAANRARFGSATGDDAAPYPQLRDLLVSDASTRGTLAVVTGPSGGDNAEAEQALLDRALTEYPHVFTEGRLRVLDRTVPGVARIKKMITVTHVLIRLKSDIPVQRAGGFLPGGSYLADVSGGGHKVLMRVIEYYVQVGGQDVPEMFCLITDLLDCRASPAGMLAAAYKRRWDGSETALREAKSAIRGAGPSTRPIFRSGIPDLIRAEHAAWITACELVRATARAAARAARPARKGRRAGQPVQAARSPSPPPAAPPSPPPATAPPPPASPPRSAATPATAHYASSAGAASASTAGGTATTRPKPGRHSPPPDAASPPAPRPPPSPSAARSPPDIPAANHRTARRIMEPAAPRSDIRPAAMRPGNDHYPYITQPPTPGTP